MTEIDCLLQQKETALRQVKRELDALRLAAALLAEAGDRPGLADLPPITAARVSTVLPFARDIEPPRRWEELPIPAPLHIDARNQRIFPESQDGFIVCDACGHRNPEYLLDCERCDIPIRLRS